jgi:glycosyltransferase involved in cell wall biosynthesis
VSRLTYAVVSPVRDEAENLRRLGEALCAQTVLPSAWVIVDNGSNDGTGSIADELAAACAWITVMRVGGEGTAVPGRPIVRAFHAGLAALEHDVDVDVVVKLDADVTFAADYFARTLEAFARDPLLGITGGNCHELQSGVWRPVPGSGDHVRGAVRCYRSTLLQQILPLPERTGWDTIDEFQAATKGWAVCVDTTLRFDHHRAVGARDGGRARRWIAKGDAAHFVGYRPFYLMLRALYQARRDPYAVAMIWGFARALLEGREAHPDVAARTLLRQDQRLRSIPRRFARRSAAA